MRISRAFIIFVAAMVLALMSIYAVHAILCLSFPHQIEYGEGLCMALTRRIIDAGALYNDPCEKPWLLCEYTPMFFLLCSVLSMGKLSFLTGRLASFVSFAVSAGLIIYVCGRSGRKYAGKCQAREKKELAALSNLSAGRLLCLGAGGWMAALLVLSDSVQLFWSVLYRVDFLGILFSILGLVFAARVFRNASRGDRTRFVHVLLAGFFLSLAFFTKQSFVSALAASVLSLLLINKKVAREYVSVCGIILGTGLLMLQMFFGDKFLFVMFKCSGMYWDFSRFWDYGFSYWIWKMPLLIIALFALKRLWNREKLWCLYAVISFMTVPTVGRAGSYYNYFLEPYLALSILVGLYAERLWRDDKKQNSFKLPVIVIIALVQSLVGLAVGFEGGALSLSSVCRNEIVPFLMGKCPSDRACEMELMDTVMAVAGETALPDGSVREARETEFVKVSILAEDMGDFVAEGYEVWLVDPATYCDLEHLGLYDFSELNDLISKRFFVFIEMNDIVRCGRLPSSTVEAIRTNYRPVKGAAGVRLLVPLSGVSSGKQK